MTSTPTLTGTHLRTYNTIFQHPISHNLEWRLVYSLLGSIGDMVEQPNGSYKVTRNGLSMVLHPGLKKDVADDQEVMDIRRFIERSGAEPIAAEPAVAPWLVVIDHREARIYRSFQHGSVPQQFLPRAPDEYFRHAHHSKQFTRGEEKPDPNSYFEPMVAALNGAGKILIFGTGTGMSSEMDQFVAWIKNRRPEIAARIVGSLVVDENHLTEDQLLAKAREFYANLG